MTAHVLELPRDLLGDGSWLIRSSQPGSFCRVGGGTEGVRTHMRDANGLPGGPRGCYHRGRGHIVRRPASNEAPSHVDPWVEPVTQDLVSRLDSVRSWQKP